MCKSIGLPLCCFDLAVTLIYISASLHFSKIICLFNPPLIKQLKKHSIILIINIFSKYVKIPYIKSTKCPYIMGYIILNTLCKYF